MFLDRLLLALLVSPTTMMMNVWKMNIKRTRESVASKQKKLIIIKSHEKYPAIQIERTLIVDADD